ncbi:MAG: pyocin knob domain-containing protein [Nitratireductor sp.]|uniref:pyocin knob domain-containing protein n=1 Tax=Nitratireductor sp. TaxID=1872084 RepID=UPI0026374C6B|nr:pyocin knob domain-containing protein [Nitratireductor sp.]MCV0352559.1 pyocin knob domain-containing protein [Nitratireductor sp.]
MPVENTTPNRNYPLPFKENELQDDVARLIGAITGIDLDIANVLVSLALKSENGHGHVVSDVTGLAAALAAKQDAEQKGLANGFASLGADGKVPAGQLPSAVFGALSYQGTWNANTNVPTIPAANASNKGWYYKVGTPGSTSIGGIDDWKIGDWVVSNGTGWDKVDNTESVVSVAGLTGAIGAAALLNAIGALPKAGGTVEGDLVVQGSLQTGHCVEISGVADLDNYTTPGDYLQRMNVDAAAGANYPVPYAGHLRVAKSDNGHMAFQFYHTYSQQNEMFFRAFYDSAGVGWSAWRKVFSADGGVIPGDVQIDGKLRLTKTNDASETSTDHAFQIGPDNGSNVIIDGNEIMARNNGVGKQLYIQPGISTQEGCALGAGTTIDGNIAYHSGNFTPGNDVYTGSSRDHTTFPVGHLVCAEKNGGHPDRNQSQVVRVHPSNTMGYHLGDSGAILAGTWRSRGRSSHYSSQWLFFLMQRTA